MVNDAAAPAKHEGNLLVRPKVLRRPAQFSNTAEQAVSLRLVAPPTTIETPEPPETTPPAYTHWQQDRPFAIILVILVVILNIAIALWLSLLQPSNAFPPSTSPTIWVEPQEDGSQVHVLDPLSNLTADRQ